MPYETRRFDEKVVVVLDHGPKLGTKSNMIFPITFKDGKNMKEMFQVEKSLWTWCVESSMELHRIVADLFPDDKKYLRLVLADFVGRQLQADWGEKLFTTDELLDPLMTAGEITVGNGSTESVISGLTLAIEALCQPTIDQKRIIKRSERANVIKPLTPVTCTYISEDTDMKTIDGGDTDTSEYSDDNYCNKRRKKKLAQQQANISFDDNLVICEYHDSKDENDSDEEVEDEIKETIWDTDDELLEFDMTQNGNTIRTIMNNDWRSDESDNEDNESDDDDEEEEVEDDNDTNESDEKESIDGVDALAIPNNGSIVIYTSLNSEDEIEELEKSLVEKLKSRNKLNSMLTDTTFLNVDRVNMYIINTYPVGAPNSIKDRGLTKYSDVLFTSVISRAVGDDLISATHAVALAVYNLISTTVSGIPMKEEAQQSGTSVNYDVELLHSRKSYKYLHKLGLLGPNGILISSSKDCVHSTVKLAWATPSPKSKWNVFPLCGNAMRATPAVVNSRPSVCLATFLTGGRNVMLEINPKIAAALDLMPNINQKLISHTLIAHKGVLFIHAIEIEPHAVLDDEELLNDVDDTYYQPEFIRSADFSLLMKECRVVPPIKEPGQTPEEIEKEKMDETLAKIEKENKEIMERARAAANEASSSKKETKEQKIEEVKTEKEGEEIKDNIEEMKESMNIEEEKENGVESDKDEEETKKKQEVEIDCIEPRQQMSRLTRYFPLNPQHTLIYNIPKRFETLFNLIRKFELTNVEVEKCKHFIQQLVDLRKNTSEMLTLLEFTCKRMNNPKDREEQFDMAFEELAYHLANYMNHSPEHLEIFNFHMKVTKLDKKVLIPTEDDIIDDNSSDDGETRWYDVEIDSHKPSFSRLYHFDSCTYGSDSSASSFSSGDEESSSFSCSDSGSNENEATSSSDESYSSSGIEFDVTDESSSSDDDDDVLAVDSEKDDDVDDSSGDDVLSEESMESDSSDDSDDSDSDESGSSGHSESGSEVSTSDGLESVEADSDTEKIDKMEDEDSIDSAESGDTGESAGEDSDEELDDPEKDSEGEEYGNGKESDESTSSGDGSSENGSDESDESDSDDDDDDDDDDDVDDDDSTEDEEEEDSSEDERKWFYDSDGTDMSESTAAGLENVVRCIRRYTYNGKRTRTRYDIAHEQPGMPPDVEKEKEEEKEPPKKIRKPGPWKTTDCINLYAHARERDSARCSSGKKDFVGRVEFGSGPALLYPNLDLSTAQPGRDNQ